MSIQALFVHGPLHREMRTLPEAWRDFHVQVPPVISPSKEYDPDAQIVCDKLIYERSVHPITSSPWGELVFEYRLRA